MRQSCVTPYRGGVPKSDDVDPLDPANNPPAAVSTEDFRAALRCFASGVTIVTAHADNEDVAMTATAFTSVSLDPPLILVSVASDSRMHEALQNNHRWAVSILAETEIATASRFALKGRVSDRLLFADLPHHRGPYSKAVLLDRALSTIECQTTQTVNAGDHTLIIGLVVATELARSSTAEPRNPLLHFQSRYRLIRDRSSSD